MPWWPHRVPELSHRYGAVLPWRGGRSSIRSPAEVSSSPGRWCACELLGPACFRVYLCYTAYYPASEISSNNNSKTKKDGKKPLAGQSDPFPPKLIQAGRMAAEPHSSKLLFKMLNKEMPFLPPSPPSLCCLWELKLLGTFAPAPPISLQGCSWA